jgi:hypothetical protein
LVENEEPEFTKEIFSLHGKNHQREPLRFLELKKIFFEQVF